MKVTVAALLIGSTLGRGGLPAKSLLAEAKDYESQGFATEACNVENPGQGCKRFYRCAYQGIDFVVAQRAAREAEKLAIQEKLRQDLLEEARQAKADLEAELARAKKERDAIRADIQKQIDDARSAYNSDKTARAKLDLEREEAEKNVQNLQKQVNAKQKEWDEKDPSQKLSGSFETDRKDGLDATLEKADKQADAKRDSEKITAASIAGRDSGEKDKIVDINKLRGDVQKKINELDSARSKTTPGTTKPGTTATTTADGTTATTGNGICVIEDACGTSINAAELVCSAFNLMAASSVAIALTIATI